jgi:hypothetical protein
VCSERGHQPCAKARAKRKHAGCVRACARITDEGGVFLRARARPAALRCNQARCTRTARLEGRILHTSARHTRRRGLIMRITGACQKKWGRITGGRGRNFESPERTSILKALPTRCIWSLKALT